MISVEDIVATSKIVDEDSETKLSVSDSKQVEIQDMDFDVNKHDDDLSGYVVEESSKEKVEFGAENLSSVGKCSVVAESSYPVSVDNGGNDHKNLNWTLKKGSCVNVDGKHGFRVGDFVWGKIKSHPWWPGQVYDPKDASDFAVKHSQEGRLLVAFFGDGSCSWCLPTQLIPFVENFVRMSTDSNSKSFQNAVQRALDEISRVLESEMICNCIPENRKVGLGRPVAKNAGIKPRVLMPNADLHRLSVPEHKASEILCKIRYFAQTVSFSSAIEVSVLRSWLSAFSRFTYGYPLTSFRDPVHIEGLEDLKKSTVVPDDFSVPTEVPFTGPQDDDSLLKSLLNSDVRVGRKRKQKSVAELMKQNTKTKSRMKKNVNEGTNIGMSSKRKKNDDQLDGGAGLRESKKRKVERPEFPIKINGDALNSEPSDSAGAMEVDGVDTTGTEAKEEFLSDCISKTRERKLSKYLSPPYTDLPVKIRWSSNSKNESDKVVKMTFVDEAASKKIMTEQTVENDKKLFFLESVVEMPVNDFLCKIEFAAIDPFSLNDDDMVLGFASAFRSSTYLREKNRKAYQKSITGKKEKSLSLPSKKKVRKAERLAEVSDSKKDDQISVLKKGKPDSSRLEIDELVSEAKGVTKKLEMMTGILENYHSRFSKEEKVSLKEVMEQLMEKVDSVSEMVETASEKVRISDGEHMLCSIF